MNQPAEIPAAAAGEAYPGEKVLSKVGHLTRLLHDSLRELGYDKVLEKAASQIPDARDRMSYVADMTQKAAERALTAIEIAKPVQDTLASEATALDARSPSSSSASSSTTPAASSAGSRPAPKRPTRN